MCTCCGSTTAAAAPHATLTDGRARGRSARPSGSGGSAPCHLRAVPAGHTVVRGGVAPGDAVAASAAGALVVNDEAIAPCSDPCCADRCRFDGKRQELIGRADTLCRSALQLPQQRSYAFTVHNCSPN